MKLTRKHDDFASNKSIHILNLQNLVLLCRLLRLLSNERICLRPPKSVSMQPNVYRPTGVSEGKGFSAVSQRVLIYQACGNHVKLIDVRSDGFEHPARDRIHIFCCGGYPCLETTPDLNEKTHEKR